MVKAGKELHELFSQILQNSEFKVDYFLSGSHVEIEINSNQTIFEHEKLKNHKKCIFYVFLIKSLDETAEWRNFGDNQG
jgi:hypothetical protein